MSDKVIFKKTGLYGRTWNSDKEKHVLKRIKKLEILRDLRSLCEIEEDVTLGDIFNILDRYKLLKSVIAQYSWCRALEDFHVQSRETFLKTDENDHLDYIEIYWCVDNDVYKGDKNFEISTGIHAIGGPCKDYEKDYGALPPSNKINYSISYQPLYEIAHLPVRLNKEIEILEPWVISSKKRPPIEPILVTNRGFSLLEVLDAIYWDISFSGDIEQKKDFIDGMKGMVDEIKSGKMPGIPLEQVEKQLGLEPLTQDEESENKMKIVFHPEAAKALGVDVDAIPLDDKDLNLGD